MYIDNYLCKENIMQQNLMHKIYCELDMIRILSRLSICAIQNDSVDSKNDSFEFIFKEIENRCWKISEEVEKLSQDSHFSS